MLLEISFELNKDFHLFSIVNLCVKYKNYLSYGTKWSRGMFEISFKIYDQKTDIKCTYNPPSRNTKVTHIAQLTAYIRIQNISQFLIEMQQSKSHALVSV